MLNGQGYFRTSRRGRHVLFGAPVTLPCEVRRCASLAPPRAHGILRGAIGSLFFLALFGTHPDGSRAVVNDGSRSPHIQAWVGPAANGPPIAPSTEPESPTPCPTTQVKVVAPPPVEPGLSGAAWIGSAAILLVFAVSLALLMGRNLSTGARVAAASVVAVSGMFVGEHLLSFDSVVKLDKLIGKLEPKVEFHVGEGDKAFAELKKKVDELEGLVRKIRYPVPSASLRLLGSIDHFPEASHVLTGDTGTAVHPDLLRLNTADLAGAQCLVVIGGADMRPLRRKAAERYGSNWSLARERALWVADQLKSLSEKNGLSTAPPLIVLTQRPNHERPGNDPELLASDRRVDVYTCVGALQPPPPVQ
jgi:hypothetical protein